MEPCCKKADVFQPDNSLNQIAIECITYFIKWGN